MNWYKVFYWLTVADSVKGFFNVISTVLLWFFVLSFIAFWIVFGCSKAKDEFGRDLTDAFKAELDRWVQRLRRLFSWCGVLCLATWTVYVLVPSTKDCKLIIAGGAIGTFLTTDSSAKQLPADLAQYFHVEMRSRIKDVLNDTQNSLDPTYAQKEAEKALRDTLAKMTPDQIIEYYKNNKP